MTDANKKSSWGNRDLLPRPKESVTHSQIAQTLRAQYPGLVFFTDGGSGAFFKGPQGGLTKAKMRNLNSVDDKPPDLFIAHPTRSTEVVNGRAVDIMIFGGLFVELKREGENLFKKDGITYKNEHIEKQAATLEKLRRLGYQAEFAIGYDSAMIIIQAYLHASGFKKLF